MSSERISVTLEADAGQLTSEFAKARMAAESLSAKALPSVERGLTQMHATNQRVATGLRQLNVSSKASGQGMLQLAQFADDAQYGIRGILNNIPGLVMGLGGGMGVAGAISLAVLAGSKLLPLLRDLAGVADPKAFDDYAAAVREAAAKTEELARSRGIAFAKAFVDSITQEESAIRLQNVALAENTKLMEVRARLAGSVAAASEALAKAEIEADPSLSDGQKRTAIAGIEAQAQARQSQEQLAALDRQAEAARAAAKEKLDAEKRSVEDIAALRRRVAAKEEALKPLTAAKEAADLAAASLPGARKKVEDLQNRLRLARFTFGFNEPELEAELNKAREELAAIEPQSVLRLENSRRAGEAEGELQELRDALGKLVEGQTTLTQSAREAVVVRDEELSSLEAQKTALKDIIQLTLQKTAAEKDGAEGEAVKAKKAALQSIISNAAVKTLAGAENKTAAAELAAARATMARGGSGQSGITWAGSSLSRIGWAGGEIPASLRGGVGIAGRPGIRGLGAAATEAERRRESTVPNSPGSALLKAVDGLREDVQALGKAVGII